MKPDCIRAGIGRGTRAVAAAAALTALALGWNGCSPRQEEGPRATAHEADGDGPDEGVRMLQSTVFGPRHEAFVEHPPATAGTAARWTVHLTDLASREPRRAGRVGFELASEAGARIEHWEAGPLRPGIYVPELVFERAGEWRVTVVLPSESGEERLVLPPVTVFAGAAEAAAAEIAGEPEGITFLKEQQWTVGLGTEPVGSRALVERMALPAWAKAKPGRSASVVAPLAGQVRGPRGGILPVPGQRVSADEVLALLEPIYSEAAVRVAVAEAEFAQAQAGAEQAEAAYDRVRALAAEQAKSERELEEARLVLATARARLLSATALRATYRPAAPDGGEAEAGLPAMELRAPIAGVVEGLGAGPGTPVEAGAAVFTILDPTVLWLEARVPETALARIAGGDGALVELPGAPGEYLDVAGLGGRRVWLGGAVDGATRTVPLVYEVPNPEGRLRVGQLLTVQVETARRGEVLALPEDALVDENGRPVAYVQLGGETFAKRELRLGIRDGAWVEVVAGIAAGERVVVQGAYAVRLASMATSIPAHHHDH